MIQTVSFPEESTTYISPTWDEMAYLAFDISRRILENSEHQFDRIITLAKGGWPMTRSLVDFLQVDEVASIGVKFYKGIHGRYDSPQIYQDLPVSVKGERVLLFDDVADTGESLLFVQNHLRELGISEIVTATLFYKPHSKVKPDYYGSETTAWIIFPYDMVDSINTLGSKWLAQGLTQSEISLRFKELRFGSEQTDYYAQRLWQ